MRVLVDNCVPRQIAAMILGHDLTTTAALGWEKLKDGALLDAAGNVCDVLVTLDKSMRYQQRLDHRTFGVVLMRAKSSRIEQLMPLVPGLLRILPNVKPGQCTVIGG